MTDVQGQGKQLRAGFFDRDAFRRKERLLLVLQSGVAGLYFHLDQNSEEGQDILEGLVPGTELKIFRDMDNEHDKWAISVYTTDDQELGYVTRFKNETIARLMDQGKKFVAYVDEPPEEPKDATERRRTRAATEDFRVPFSVYMVEQ